MRTLKILALTCLLVAPTFATKKHITIGQVTTKETPGRNSSQSSIDAELAAEQKINESRFVKVMTPVKHRVKRGEHLRQIARNFDVTWAELCRVNPQFNFRNPNKIFPGEVINIPVYRLSGRVIPYRDLPSAVFDDTGNELVTPAPADAKLMASALIGQGNEIMKLQNYVATNQKVAIIAMGVILAFVVLSTLLGGNLLIACQEKGVLRQRVAEADQNTANAVEAAVKAATLPESPVDFIKLLQTANGNVLSLMVHMPVTHDELGNPVTIKKIDSFLDKRPYLSGIPAEEWPKAMADYAQRTSNSGAAREEMM